ncbi:MAG: CaiB/BaiF CoA transferase family protein [Tepidiformaceae bacterium]
MADRALDGLRIIEFCDETGSYCGRLLADLGAEVIKVEPPEGGRQRHTPPYLKVAPESVDTSLAFWVHNTSKKSVVLDLETAAGQTAARALVLSADAVIEDNAVGWMAERGLGYGDLSSEKPSLVYTSIAGFGQDGPHAAYTYSDIVGQAMGGMMTLAGEPADAPNMVYGHQADVGASIQAAQGTIMALIHTENTGEGQQVDVSVQEAMSLNQETAMQTWDLQKRNRVRTGERGMLPIQLPGAGNYPCKDGDVFCYILAPGGSDFPVLVEWMREEGMAEDLDEEPFASVCNQLNMGFLTQVLGNPEAAQGMVPQLMHINDVLRRFFASMTATEAYVGGQSRLILNGIVSTPRDLAENEQLRARDWFAQLEADFLHTSIEFPGAPYRLSATPVVISRPPRLGEHSDEVLGALKAAGGAR